MNKSKVTMWSANPALMELWPEVSGNTIKGLREKKSSGT